MFPSRLSGRGISTGLAATCLRLTSDTVAPRSRKFERLEVMRTKSDQQRRGGGDINWLYALMTRRSFVSFLRRRRTIGWIMMRSTETARFTDPQSNLLIAPIEPAFHRSTRKTSPQFFSQLDEWKAKNNGNGGITKVNRLESINCTIWIATDDCWMENCADGARAESEAR